MRRAKMNFAVAHDIKTGGISVRARMKADYTCGLKMAVLRLQRIYLTGRETFPKLSDYENRGSIQIH